MASSSISNLQQAAENIPIVWYKTKDKVVTDIRNSFLVGFLVFLILLPFLRSRKSWCDIISARKVITILRFLVFVEIELLIVLLYFVIKFGSPLKLNIYTDYGNGQSWIFGFTRPVAGICLIGMGMVGSMHPLARYMCMLGCSLQISFDAISAMQIIDYLKQISDSNAPIIGHYTKETLSYYYFRDIVSIGFSTCILFLMIYLSCIIGWCNPPFISFQKIEGADMDRLDIMRKALKLRQMGPLGIDPTSKSKKGVGNGNNDINDSIERGHIHYHNHDHDHDHYHNNNKSFGFDKEEDEEML